MPAPSTVGSGRKQGASIHRKPPTFSLQGPEETLLESIAMEEDVVDLLPILQEPLTPGGQLINDELVKHWHGKSYNNYSSSDEEDEEEEDQPKLVNPFVGPASTKSTSRNVFADPFNSQSKNEVDYQTHMELVNNKTGERRVVKLSSRQSKIKPKKLDFSQC